MFRTIYWYLYFGISLIFRIPIMLKMKKLKQTMSKDEFYKKVNQIVNKWVAPQIKNAGAKVHMHGLENIPDDKNVLFVSNHQGYFDIALFLSIQTDLSFISKIEMLKVPLLSTWMSLLGCIFMDRKDFKSQGKAILDGIKLLKEGFNLVIFPEGTRSKKSELGEFKQGSLKLATKSKVPIIPVTIDGSYKLMEGNNYFIKPADVYMTFHAPIETKDIKNNDIETLNNTIIDTIKSGFHYIES